MDETLQELENELKRLTPRRPSPSLMRALEHHLGAEVASESAPRHRTVFSLRSWKWTTWSLAGAAAAIALVILVQSSRRPVPAPMAPAVALSQRAATPAVEKPVNRYEPVQASSVLYDLKEDGTAQLPDQTEGRQVRYRYVDTYTWKNPATNASLRWSVPRDEVRLVRANLD
jgi:hypothetical protein